MRNIDYFRKKFEEFAHAEAQGRIGLVTAESTRIRWDWDMNAVDRIAHLFRHIDALESICRQMVTDQRLGKRSHGKCLRKLKELLG